MLFLLIEEYPILRGKLLETASLSFSCEDRAPTDDGIDADAGRPSLSPLLAFGTKPRIEMHESERETRLKVTVLLCLHSAWRCEMQEELGGGV